MHAGHSPLIEKTKQNLTLTAVTESARQRPGAREPFGRTQHLSHPVNTDLALAGRRGSVDSMVMIWIIRICLVTLIVLLPREGLPEAAPEPEPCKTMALLEARFLLDEPDRQKQLTPIQLELLGICGVSMVGIDLTGRALGAIRLPGADLTNAELAGASFGGPEASADLKGTNFNGTNFERADLRRADLTGADMRHTFLEGARLDGANLSGARLGWPQAHRQAAEQKLAAQQLSAACWSPDNPPHLPVALKSYKRAEDKPSDCPSDS